MRPVKRLLLLLSLLASLAAPAYAQQQDTSAALESVNKGSLEELRGKRRILLMVRRVAVLDASGQGKSVLAEIYGERAESRSRFPRTYNVIARLLNKYMIKHQSISAARSVPEAEFIVFFNLLEYRRPLGTPYPYGEMFVILNERSKDSQPRIIWRTRKSPLYAEDAAKELIKDLKAARGEG